MIFLNIDYDYFFSSQQDISIDKNKNKWADSRGFFSKINKNLIIEKYCFLDHNKALFHWDKVSKDNIHCIHIDAHHDLYADELIDWVLPNKIRGSFIGVGNYLFKALIEKKISSITWIIPDWLDKKEALLDLTRYIGKGYINRIEIKYYSELNEIKEKIYLTISISPEWIPNIVEEIPKISTFLNEFNFDDKIINNIKTEIVARIEKKDFNANALKYRFQFKD
tara:strand:+ start:584 stop:1252 length:669 start_codon:yes stop_codon:yes gene_type:complete